jgi:hypothetical protein
MLYELVHSYRLLPEVLVHLCHAPLFIQFRVTHTLAPTVAENVVTF